MRSLALAVALPLKGPTLCGSYLSLYFESVWYPLHGWSIPFSADYMCIAPRPLSLLEVSGALCIHPNELQAKVLPCMTSLCPRIMCACGRVVPTVGTLLADVQLMLTTQITDYRLATQRGRP
jgi:hypothetical protein